MQTALCACGCGQSTTLRRWGRDRTNRYLPGHHLAAQHAARRIRALDPSQWHEEDRGFESPCWIANGNIYTSNGYAYIGRSLAHRRAYEEAKGPIPRGLIIDHRCRQRACRRPEHLEAVTPRENIRRAWLRDEASSV